MAAGKNKRKPRKGNKKKIIDPFTRKEWYDIKAPNIFSNPKVGKTMVNKTIGKILATDNLKGRIFKVSLADLNKNEDLAYRTINLIAEDVQGSNVLTNFAGMDFTSDKVKGLIKKWQSLIEGHVDIKTTDGYVVRLFAIGFTRKRINQMRITSYAQSSQIKQIRKKMVDIMVREAANQDLKGLFKKFIPETIGRLIELECQGIYPLKDCFVRKAKILKKPRFDAYKLAELHTERSAKEDTGAPVNPPTE